MVREAEYETIKLTCGRFNQLLVFTHASYPFPNLDGHIFAGGQEHGGGEEREKGKEMGDIFNAIKNKTIF